LPQGNGNHFGVIYAGAQFTEAEILGGIIALSTFDRSTYFPLGKNVDISFVGMPGLNCGREPASTTRRSRGSKPKRPDGVVRFTLEAVVTDVDGRTVAITRGLCQLRAIGT
jgi:hypothetical protein